MLPCTVLKTQSGKNTTATTCSTEVTHNTVYTSVYEQLWVTMRVWCKRGPRRGTRRGAGDTGGHHRVSVAELVARTVPGRSVRGRQRGSHTLWNACRLDSSGLPCTLCSFELLILSLKVKAGKLVGGIKDLEGKGKIKRQPDFDFKIMVQICNFNQRSGRTWGKSEETT